MASDDRQRQRLRLQGFDLHVFPDGRCKAEVSLEWVEGSVIRGEADGTKTLESTLRAAALACVEAAEKATEDDLELELRGVKAVRAFDAWVVIVSVEGRGEDQPYRLLGAATSPDDESLPRSTVQAVLDATNRVLEKYL